MKSIDLVKCSEELFSSELERCSFDFFTNNESLYREIWKEQDSSFWLKFVLTLRSVAHKHLLSCPETYDWIFVDLLKKLCDKRFCKLSRHVKTVALIIGCNQHFANLEAFVLAQHPDKQRAVRQAIHIIYGAEKNVKLISEDKLQHHYSLTLKCVAAFLKLFHIWTSSQTGDKVIWLRPNYWSRSSLQAHPMEIYLEVRFGAHLPAMLGVSKEDLGWWNSPSMIKDTLSFDMKHMAVNLEIPSDATFKIKWR